MTLFLNQGLLASVSGMPQKLHFTLGALLLFAAGQGLAFAHELEFGPEPHDHHGAPCILLYAEDEPDLIHPPVRRTRSMYPREPRIVPLTRTRVPLAAPRLRPPAAGPPNLG
ncbi:MAG: hypothetical protein AAGI15_11995 [Pseudomonadota bacterium]